MLKCISLMKSRILQLSVAQCIFQVLCVMAIIHLFTYYGSYNYHHIPADELHSVLHRETVPHLKKTQQDCNYDDILKNDKTINNWDIPKKFDDFSPNGIVNGSYTPQHCHPAFSVAVLVTYRNRQKQLDVFLPYMHDFLRKQNIHYKIFLIEQRDESPWNKGLLYNVGARAALAERFPCVVLHDVDLLPLDAANLYACARRPRHMSAAIDKFRYVLPYGQLVGGALAMRSDQFSAVDGLSNRFTAWGGEDDDLARRLREHGLAVLRFPRTMSRYTMLIHRQEPKNSARLRIMAENKMASVRANDGMRSARYTSLEVKHHRLFTLLAVTT